jgi:hypothetical protein
MNTENDKFSLMPPPAREVLYRLPGSDVKKKRENIYYPSAAAENQILLVLGLLPDGNEQQFVCGSSVN